MPDEAGEQMPKIPEREESSMERERRIKRLVEEKPIGGGQETSPEERPEADIDALVRAKVEAAVAEVKAEVADLRAKLETSEAHREALEKEVATLKGVEALIAPLEKIRAATERTATKEEAEIERLLIPEDERPKAPEQWAALVRKELANLRDRGESPYSPYLWMERPEIKRILDSIPRREWRGISAEEWKKIHEDLSKEIWVVQKEDALATQYSQRSNTIDGLKELIDIAPATGVELDPEKLDALSNLPAAEVPKYLEGIIDEGESMSVQISRAVYFYTKFFGDWAEMVSNEIDKPRGIEDQGRRMWKNGDFGKDKRKWEGWVGEQIQGNEKKGIALQNSTIERGIKAQKQAVNTEVLERLGFGKEGIIPYSVLKEIFKKIPEEALAEEKYKDLKKKIEEAGETGGLSLLELFDKNMFCHSVNAAESRYTHWLVSMLTGSEYAGESALRFLRYTGESGEMNTTHIPGTWAADAFTRIPWIERRRLSEARKRRAGGPRMTLGRYKFDIKREGKERGLCHSWLREAEIKINGQKKKIVELLRSKEIWFYEIPWNRLDRGSYVNDFLLPLSHCVAIFKALTNPNIELVGHEGLLSQVGALEALNKSFQYAFADWEQGKVVFSDEDGTGWEKREKWAQTLLRKKLSEINQLPWSPWVSFGAGLIYEHHPERRLSKEFVSPTGIKKERQIPHSRRWHKDRQKAEGGQLWLQNSVADFLGEGADQEFFTPSEVELIKRICNV